jgi:hypothetical protein
LRSAAFWRVPTTFVEIEEWAKEKSGLVPAVSALEHGIPSHDTFGRVFAAIDAEEFGDGLPALGEQRCPASLGKDEVVAIDGKTSRRSGKVDATPLHLVSAFAAGAGLVLGQRATAEKSNEKTAIPELLATLALEGCIVTIDAMGTQPNIAQAIRDRGAQLHPVGQGQPTDPGRFDAGLLRRVPGRAGQDAPRLRRGRGERITADWRCAAATPSISSIACMPRSAGRT